MSEDETEEVRTLRRTHGLFENDTRPIVLEYRKRKQKIEGRDAEGKERYSPRLADIQRAEGAVMRVTQKAAKALAKGIDTYEHERQRSSEKKRDGSIEDFVVNSAKAASASLKEASDIPVDLAESVNRRSYRKRPRKSPRMVSRLLRLWRIRCGGNRHPQ